MEPVDINSKELQELKSAYNDLKETLNKQRIINKELLEQIRKQKTSFIGNDLKTRMMMDITSVPIILIICNAVGWPMLFAAAVSLWALIDLVATLLMRKKFDTQKMLDDDVLTVAKTVKEYKRFYHLSTIIGAIPAVIMTIYIICHIYNLGAPDDDFLLVMALCVFIYLAGIPISIKRYKKTMATCDNLIDSLESK